MKLFFADTETTGLDPKLNEMFQLAYLIEIDGKVVEEVEIRFRPEREEHISPEALEITGKTKEELLGYPPKKRGYDLLIQKLSKWVDRFDREDKLVWIGQNPEFDVRFVRNFFKEMGDKYFGSWFNRGPADLITLAKVMKVKGHINPRDFKLGTLAENCGIPLKPHDALDDVRATYQIWNKLMAVIPQGPGGS